ncbi:hypothetical protein ANN_24450 [Periplaneta americana]|uniref:RNase H type-1 domain-containing protein n=1 Tax=Periplaneta americana TaxID=6978 RepID=A0ABQ8S325_PERAM|nr:hypothetical protein ANN_24450 [Periplaneta americana]
MSKRGKSMAVTPPRKRKACCESVGNFPYWRPVLSDLTERRSRKARITDDRNANETIRQGRAGDKKGHEITRMILKSILGRETTSIESVLHCDSYITVLVSVPLHRSRVVTSWSKASCLGLALRNARWFEPSCGKKFSHEISRRKCNQKARRLLSSDESQPGHHGNETADRLAKEAATSRDIDECYNRTPKSVVLSEMSENSVVTWQSEGTKRRKMQLQ